MPKKIRPQSMRGPNSSEPYANSETPRRSFFFAQQGLALMKDDPAQDHSGLEQYMREMEQRVAELQEQIDKLSPTFEVEEKPR